MVKRIFPLLVLIVLLFVSCSDTEETVNEIVLTRDEIVNNYSNYTFFNETGEMIEDRHLDEIEKDFLFYQETILNDEESKDFRYEVLGEKVKVYINNIDFTLELYSKNYKRLDLYVNGVLQSKDKNIILLKNIFPYNVDISYTFGDEKGTIVENFRQDDYFVHLYYGFGEIRTVKTDIPNADIYINGEISNYKTGEDGVVIVDGLTIGDKLRVFSNYHSSNEFVVTQSKDDFTFYTNSETTRFGIKSSIVDNLDNMCERFLHSISSAVNSENVNLLSSMEFEDLDTEKLYLKLYDTYKNLDILRFFDIEIVNVRESNVNYKMFYELKIEQVRNEKSNIEDFKINFTVDKDSMYIDSWEIVK